MRYTSARRVLLPLFVLVFAIAELMLGGCGGSGGSAGPLTFAGASLSAGKIGVPYAQAFTAGGGKTPYHWALTGTLPSGLSLDASAGAISGTPTTAVTGAPITVTVTDSSSPVQSASASLHLTVNATVSVSPKNAAVIAGQVVSLKLTTNDPTGVNWTATGSGCSGSGCGVLSAATSLNGANETWTAPGPGAYTLKAVSVGDGTTTATVAAAVTDLSGVATVHYDTNRDGANTKEYALTPTAIGGGSFGKLFSCTVDGAVYAQPLWVPAVMVGGAKHNVVYVATQHDSLYAFDADSNTSPCAALWHANLVDGAHGGTGAETSVPSSGPNRLVGAGYGDIAPEVGVTGTPVIDVATKTLYVVSKSVDASGPNFYQRLHAIDLATGAEKLSGPVTIAGTYPGTGDGTGTTTFVAQQQNQRPGLALANGTVYIAWSSHEDETPYYGWVMGYDAATLAQKAVVNISPNVGWGGIWMDGNAPPVDADGNLYITIGNAVFDADATSGPTNDYGDSFVKLDKNLVVQQYFTPSDQLVDNQVDADFGSGGATLVDLPAHGANPTHLVLGGGKDGFLYVLNRDQLGGFGDANAWQRMNWQAGIFATAAYWNGTLYMAGNGQSIQAYPLNATTAEVASGPSSTSANSFGFPGTSPVVSSMPDNSNGIVWALDNSKYCTPQSPGCGAAVLHAYNPANLATEYWNSGATGTNAAGYAVKFTVPTVANGRVYVGTRGTNIGGSDNTTSVPGELDVYGLQP